MVRAGQNVVVDGRDIGTVVFPDADLKIFLTASPEARAGRRITQRGHQADRTRLDAETAALAARDQADSTRPVAPLAPRPTRFHLDTTTMGFADQVRFIVELARPIFGRGWPAGDVLVGPPNPPLLPPTDCRSLRWVHARVILLGFLPTHGASRDLSHAPAATLSAR